MLKQIITRKDVEHMESGGRVDRHIGGLLFWHMVDGRFYKEGIFGDLPFGFRLWWQRSVIDNDHVTYQFTLDRQRDAKPIPATYQKGRSAGYFLIGLTIALFQGIIALTVRTIRWARRLLSI